MLDFLVIAWLATFVLFAIPLLRTVSLSLSRWRSPVPVWKRRGVQVVPGRIEYFLGPIRDRFFAGLLFLGALGVLLWHDGREIERVYFLLFLLSYQLMALLARQYRLGVRLQLLELARLRSEIHPRDFFDLYYAMLSPWPPRFPESGFRTVDFGAADFRSGKPMRWRRGVLLSGVASTLTLASLASLGFGQMGEVYGREAFDALARIWGGRIAQQFRLALRTLGAERVPALEGRVLLIFNHVSYFDFVFNFFALGVLRKTDRPFLRPRFIAAKDHFIDRKIIYSGIRLGKTIESAGMVFVNRREKGKGWAAMAEAAEKLVAQDVEIAVYPQGTRGLPMRRGGQRWGVGYFSSFSKKNRNEARGHLKPGTAHLILNALLQLRERGEKRLTVLAVGILGAGDVGPKGDLRVQTETEVVFRLAEPWVLSVVEVEKIEGVEDPRYAAKLAEIQAGIDAKLLEALDWREVLREKSGSVLEEAGIDSKRREFWNRFFSLEKNRERILLWSTVDRALSLRDETRRSYFLRLLELVERDSDEGEWQSILEEVTRNLNDSSIF